jgi:hypothetical protein
MRKSSKMTEINHRQILKPTIVLTITSISSLTSSFNVRLPTNIMFNNRRYLSTISKCITSKNLIRDLKLPKIIVFLNKILYRVFSLLSNRLFVIKKISDLDDITNQIKKQDKKDKIEMIYAIFGISSLSSISIGLQHTLDDLSMIFFDRQLGSVILGISIFSFGLGFYSSTLYNYFFPPISSTIFISPISPIIENTLEKPESMVPLKDVFISSIPSNNALISINDLTFIKDTLMNTTTVLTNNQLLLTFILRAKLSDRFKLPSNTSINNTFNEIGPVLEDVELATKLLEHQVTLVSHTESIVSQITNL